MGGEGAGVTDDEAGGGAMVGGATGGAMTDGAVEGATTAVGEMIDGATAVDGTVGTRDAGGAT